MAKMLRAAKEHRARVCEAQWRRNEKYVYRNDPALAASMGNVNAPGNDSEDFDDPEYVEVAYTFKDMRYLHSELCSSPPAIQATPLSSDGDARAAARAGDQAARYIREQYHLQERYDLSALDVMAYGTGIQKTIHDPDLGEVVRFDKKTGKIKLSGDLFCGRVSVWDFFPSPKSTGRLDIPHAFERFRLSPAAFCSRWPHLRGMLQGKLQEHGGKGIVASSDDRSSLQDGLDEWEGIREIELYELWIDAAPENANLGGYAVIFEDGTIVEPPRPSPMALPEPLTLEQRRTFRKERKLPRRRRLKAIMPYHVWTDIDVPGRLWGKSFLEYAGPLQALMNNLDSALLELVKVHGIFRMVLPPGAELQDNQLENDAARVYRLKAGPSDGGRIEMVPPAGVPGSMQELRAHTRVGIDDMAGVNESNFGQQSREQSSYLMQFAASQGRMIRARLMNKAAAVAKSVNYTMVRLAAYTWDDKVMVEVLGKERAFDSVALRGVDFDGGFKFVAEYGNTLPMDPDLRRDTLLKYLPLYKEGGIPPRKIAKAARFADFGQLEDPVELAESRQQEIFDIIEATGEQVEIGEGRHMDHVNMLAYAKYYVNTAPFQSLPDEIKSLINAHIDLRAQAAAAQRPAQAAAVPGEPLPGAPAAAPGGGAPALPLAAPTAAPIAS